LEKEFAPQFTVEDLVNLGFAQIYLKLMIDGLGSAPFSAVTLPPIVHPDTSFVRDIIDASREQFARPRASVEEGIVKFHEPTPPPPKTPPASTPKSTPVSKSPLTPVSISAAVSHTGASDTQSSSPARSVPAGSDAASPRRRPSELQVKPPSQSDPEMSSTPARAAAATQFQNIPTNEVDRGSATTIPAKRENITPVAHPPLAPVPIKLAPLSALASKSVPKSDPKIRTQKNIGDLKSALAAVLAKQTPAPAKLSVENKKPQAPLTHLVESSPPSSDGAPVPKEVPEGVLRKVLKVE
jgi:hypothetical protein